MLNLDALASGTDQGARDMRAHLSNIVRGSEPGADMETIARAHISANWMTGTLRSAFGNDAMKSLDFYTGALTWARKRYGHVSSPDHEAGTLYDCPACESECFCEALRAVQIADAEDTEETVCVCCAIGAEQMQAHADRKFGRRT